MNGTVWTWELADKSNPAFNQLFKKFSKMDKTVEKIEGGTTNAFDKMDRSSKKFSSNFKKNLKEAKDEIPGLNRGLNLLRNPLVLGAAAAVGFFAVVNKATQAQKAFNHEFLELRNLNMDKPQSEIDKLRDTILDLSFEKGLDPNKTSKAFFDVQSATGKYGDEVTQIVGKVGKFAQVMKADFNVAIAGASKAMGIFNIGASQMDDFLASSFKTVQVGVTTFDELAKVQTEYFGSAAAANQSFDNANKLFAVFSANAKNVDIAATKTRGAFEDLTKARTIKGFDKIGVSIFDAAGNVKGLDKITEELVPKFKTLSDLEFANLKEEIGGNEGLRGYLDSLKNSGDQVLDTFKKFNETNFDIDQAIDNANGDLELMSQLVENKLTVAWIKFGDAISPIILKIKQGLADLIDMAADFFQGFNDYSERSKWSDLKDEGKFTDAIEVRAKQYKNSDQFSDFFDANRGSLEKRNKQERIFFAKANQSMWEDEMKQAKENFKRYTVMDDFDKAFNARVQIMQLEESIKKSNEFVKNNGNLNIFDKAENTTTNTGVPSVGGSSSTQENFTGISAGSNNVRNVTVNIDKLIEQFTVNREGSELDENEISRKVEEVIVRAVRDAELTLSN